MNGKPLQLTVLDSDAENRLRQFYHRYPIKGYEDVIDEKYWEIDFIQEDLCRGCLKTELLVDNQGSFKYDHVIVCLEDDEISLLTAVDIVEKNKFALLKRNAKISVLSRKEVKLAALLDP